MSLLLPYSTEHVVVGGTLDAFMYAYVNRYPIVYTTLQIPHMFQRFLHGTDLSLWLIKNESLSLKSPSPGLNLGYPSGNAKKPLYTQIRLALAMEGYIIGGDSAATIRIEQDKQRLKLIHKTAAQISEVYYDTLHIFDDRFLEGINTQAYSGVFQVLDWFHCKNFKLHDFDVIDMGTFNNAIQSAFFHKSFRSPFIKDLVVLSWLTSEALQNSDYSDAIVRIKLEDLMNDLPFYSSNRAKRLECVKREVIYQIGPQTSTEKIKFHRNDFNHLESPGEHMHMYKMLFNERQRTT
jgi:hypothetical protein